MTKAALRPPSADSLYDRDFYAWTQEQGRALATRADRRLDIVNLIDEVESLGGSQRTAIESRLAVLIAHLLKMLIQPEQVSASWRGTTREQRRKIAQLIARSPSLHTVPSEALPDAYDEAIRVAARDTFLEESAFPEVCPFTLEQILDPGFEP